MFGRNKIDPFDTINLCNQFLILYLSKKAQAFQTRGLINNARVYRNAIYSIKRYPLPIICKAQLESLNGIGEYLSEQLEKQVKKHYSAYLDSNLKPKFSNNQQEEKEEVVSRSVADLSQRFPAQQEIESNNQTQSRATKSATVQYKPRVNTVNAYFLQVLHTFTHNKQTHPKGIHEATLQQQVLKKYPTTKNKTWKMLLQTLESNAYITSQKSLAENTKKQQTFHKLTEKGLTYTRTLNSKTKTNESKAKIINQVKYFKEQIINSKKTSIKNTTNTLQAFCSNGQFQQKQNNSDKLTPKVLQLQQKDISLDRLVLMIDSREKNQKSQIHFFSQKITKKYKINCKNTSLNLGDFLWIYDDKVLDFIIERKKADDLAASILDGRYKDQKYRLNECGMTNIFYVYEGYPSDNCCLTQKELNSALLKTRAKEKFRVYQTKDINETMKLLNTFHLQIFQKITNKKAKYLTSFDEFNESNSIQKQFTVGKAFATGLMAIPGVGKNAINVLTQYFKTYRGMYDYLIRFGSNEERIEFLKNLFKGSGMMISLPRIIVELLFSQNYREVRGDKEEVKQYKDVKEIQVIVQSKEVYKSWDCEEQSFEQRLQRLKKNRFSVIHQEQQINQQQQEDIDI